MRGSRPAPIMTLGVFALFRRVSRLQLVRLGQFSESIRIRVNHVQIDRPGQDRYRRTLARVRAGGRDVGKLSLPKDTPSLGVKVGEHGRSIGAVGADEDNRSFTSSCYTRCSLRCVSASPTEPRSALPRAGFLLLPATRLLGLRR